jgi:nucleoside 2-deoxyribosyltransferase
MALSVYVATKWENKDEASVVMGQLRAAGYEISYDWTLAQVERWQQAMLDLKGVAEADIYLGLFQKEFPYTGALVEMGYALALGKPVYILEGSKCAQSLFFHHPNVRKIKDLSLFLGGFL